jgi:lipopolysaccharide transport system permease protein
VLEPTRGLARRGLRELWAYRELLYFLVWRDVKVRYKQTVLGAAWAVLQPFLTMVVFSFVFGHLAGIRSEGLPYPVFSFAALLPWQLFAHALTQSSASLVANQNLITKVYFPRLLIPLASVLGGLVDFGAAFVLLLALMGYYRVVPGPSAGSPIFRWACSLAPFRAMRVREQWIRRFRPWLRQGSGGTTQVA